MDKHLSHQQFIAGEYLTVADIGLLATLEPAEQAEIDLSVYPHLTKWRNLLRDKLFYKTLYTAVTTS